jgi:hypothetical protein
VSAQHIDDLTVLSAQTPNSFQNRQGRLTRPVLFQTLASTYSNASIRRYALGERIDQGGFADPRFSFNKNYLTGSAKHPLKPASHPR